MLDLCGLVMEVSRQSLRPLGHPGSDLNVLNIRLKPSGQSPPCIAAGPGEGHCHLSEGLPKNRGCSAPILLARLRSSHNGLGLPPYFFPGVFGGSALGLTGFTRDMMTLSMLPGICTRSVVAAIFFLRPLPQARFPFAACCPLYLPLFTTALGGQGQHGEVPMAHPAVAP